ncbi:uncharacterized protein BDV17DRAFT_294481 [Aspergillus undulatus]|uniref:uncharacterized protein n=1 Tax=Aspergillus undulatus TaxID=1810928 RepID=UPI003CCD08FE
MPKSDIQVGWWVITGCADGEQQITAIRMPYVQVTDGTWVNWENIEKWRKGSIPWDMETFGK